MKKLFILLLFVYGCNCDHDISTVNPLCMTIISDGQPVQMWLNGQQVYNNQQPGYIDKYCFHQEFKCTTAIPFQIRESSIDKTYKLRVLDAKTNEVLVEVPYTKRDIYNTTTSLDQLQFVNPEFEVSMFGWGNFGGLIPFNWDVSGIRANGAGPNAAVYQSRDTKWPPGHYVIEVDVDDFSTGGSAPFTRTVQLRGSNDDFATFDVLGAGTPPVPRGGVLTAVTIEFDMPTAYKDLGFVFSKDGPTGGTLINLRVDRIKFISVPEADYSGSVHDLSFTPSTYGLCDKAVVFNVIEDSGAEVLFAYSDIVKLPTMPTANVEVKYKSIKPYASLYYDDESTYFSFLIPARFYVGRDKTETEGLELSNNKVIDISGSLKKQRELVVEYMPEYMHNKLIIALQHAISGSLKVTEGIDEYEWVLDGEEYQYVDSQAETFDMKAARIWLTRKDYYLTNVI